MRLTLQIESGFQQGHRWQLSDDQSMTVGRTEWADVACETDERMSRVHFQVTLERGICLLKDLNSTNGTQLNGQFVSESPLNPGDRIEAGRTTFAVEIEDAGVASTNEGGDQRKSHQLVRDHKRTVSGLTVAYNVQRLDSGWMCFQGGPFGDPFQPEAPAQVATLLGEYSPLTMIVDPKKTGAIPAEVGAGQPLFDWLPKDIAPLHSPLVVPVKPSPDLDEFVNGGWGNDALMILLYRGEQEPLVNHLRSALSSNDQGKPVSRSSPPASILGYYYPGVLASLVSKGDPALVERLLQSIDAVLMEVPDQGNGWRIYAREGFEAVVQRSGFFENLAV